MLDTAEEAKFAELREKCRELKVPPPPQIMIHLKVHDKRGALVFDDVQRGHSWTRNFYNFNFGFMADARGADSTFGAGKMSAKNTGATVNYSGGYAVCRGSNYAYTYTSSGLNADTATSAYGIVVGTGDTAFAYNDYILATQIAHGNSATQLFHQAETAAAPVYTAGSKTWSQTWTRIFNNNSGASITVKEAGLIYYGEFCDSLVRSFLWERSVLAPTVAVANGAQLTVSYEISMDFTTLDT